MSASFKVLVNNKEEEGFNKTVSDNLTFDLVKSILVEEHGTLKKLKIQNAFNERFGSGEVLPVGNYTCYCETEQGILVNNFLYSDSL